MVQATIETTTTRRSVLAGFAVLAASSTPAIACVMPTATDPVFAAIRAHQTAAAHLREVTGKHFEIVSVVRAETTRFENDLLAKSEGLFEIVEIHGKQRRVFRSGLRHHDAYCKAKAAGIKQIEDKHGLELIEDSLSQAHDDESNAVSELSNTVPRTRVGTIALLQYVTDFEQEREIHDFVAVMFSVLSFLTAEASPQSDIVSF